VEKCAPFIGEPVFLETAVRLVRNGHFEQAIRDEGVDVALVVEVGVGEAGAFQELGFGLGGAGAGGENLGDLLTDWHTDLLTRLGVSSLPQGGEDGSKQELDEGVRVARFVAGGEDFVVIRLAVADDGFHREVGEERIPTAENERLPEATDAAIAIGEGVYELQLVVEDATGDERMGIGALEPAEQILHEAGNPGGGRCEVDDLLALGDADGAGAEFPGVVDQAFHKEPVGSKQIF